MEEKSREGKRERVGRKEWEEWKKEERREERREGEERRNILSTLPIPSIPASTHLQQSISNRERREDMSRAMMVDWGRKESDDVAVAVSWKQQPECGNLDLDTFPTHHSALHSQLHHFYWVKYYVLYIIKKLKLRRIQWYRLARNITALLQCNSMFLCINSSILSIIPTKTMSNITYYISIERYKWVEFDYIVFAVRFALLLKIITK